jgi:subtilisin-like proprotein convertase family protein
MNLLATLALLLPQSVAQIPASAELLWADVGFDRAWFQVAAPDAQVSAAARLNDDRAGKDGRVPAPRAGYLLAGRLIVEAEDAQLLSVLAADLAGAAVEPLGEVRGFWLVHADSIRAALRLQEALAPIYGTDRVYLDARQPLPTRLPTDPGFNNQWHLRNTVNTVADANVEGAWNAGVTGLGIVIGVVDGGVYQAHPDLAANYNATASQTGNGDSHGTSCAGVAAAVEGNNQGGVGAAYDAQWSKMHFGFSSQNATAFAFRNDLNDIKTNSWGPADNGTLANWTSAEATAIRDAVTLGRTGLGVVFCWAAGNGGTSDRVEYDPYASSRYTIAVGAVTDGDQRSYYNEQGSSMFIVAQSDGGNRGIYTTSGSNGYTSNFGGTSSASPLGAGVVALMLSANPALGWRDVYHILVDSARQCDAGNSLWLANAAGVNVNLNYGFGAVDAAAAVTLAQSWTNVGPELAQDSGVQSVNAALPDNNTTGLTRTVAVGPSFQVEAVELILNVDHNYIGDLAVELTSPSGTNSILTKKRPDSQDDFVNYVLTSFRNWDEDSAGTWTVKISDQSAGTTGTWQNFRLIVYGNDGSGGAGGGSVLTTGAIVAGANAQIFLAQGLASAPAWLAASKAGLGSTAIPQLGVTLGLASPFLLAGPNATDAAGALTWTVAVPANAAGASFWLQAAQSGLVSNVHAGVVQ